MDFKYKCYLQRVFSAIPNGEKLNYIFQKNITKRLPRPDKIFNRKIDNALSHYENYKVFNRLKDSPDIRQYYEFGAGWDLIIPLSIAQLGFEVTCIDIRKLLMPELILNTILRLNAYKNEANDPISAEVSDKSDETLLKYMKDNFNLNYFAPKDARDTGFASDSFDFISSSNTFEHIPKKDIYAILLESYRILKVGGVFSMRIDYQDHWSYFDKNISAYNYLKYSSEEWRKYNPSLHYQNRLRHSDYMGLISQTDFKVVKETPRYPTNSDLEVLNRLDIDEEFSSYDKNDLGIRGSEIVLLKQS
ncbi:methyltransferase domain-containing protein [Pontibacter sp. BT731]|uniref:methyltransferase domain-containing protein n=1 Tax=Pontibacter coccineus TaxID=3063328 RepID=UPI0026E15215|nr:methyltransferase domain-containing protein [Pontibacter sp. BT731]MDO6388781.1 methyltransferase domain-containing protein [Pontibacter sp. BT731]